MNEQEIINELALMGFANGEKFADESDVRRYLSVAVQQSLFGHKADLTQDQLDEIAKYVLAERYHMEDSETTTAYTIETAKGSHTGTLEQVWSWQKEYQGAFPLIVTPSGERVDIDDLKTLEQVRARIQEQE